MKKFAFLLISVGILIFIGIFYGYYMNIWRILEFLLGILFVSEILNIFEKNKKRNNIEISIGDHKKRVVHIDAEDVEEELDEALEDVEDSDAPAFAKKIAKTSINYAKDHVGKNEKPTKKRIKKALETVFRSIIVGGILIIDSLGLFGLALGFWQIVLVIIAGSIMGYGLSRILTFDKKVINGVISILISTFIFSEVIFNLNSSFLFYLQVLLGAILVLDSLHIFKSIKGHYIGNLIFGSILLLDAFNILPGINNVWQMLLLLIASYLLGHGVTTIFFKKGKFDFKNYDSEDKSYTSYKVPSMSKSLNKIKYDLDWTKLNIYAEDIEELLQADSKYIKGIFESNLTYSDSGEYSATIKNKIKVSNIKIPNRAVLNTKLNKNTSILLDLNFSVCDALLDLRNTKVNTINLNSTASKITIIPSNIIESTIDSDLEITSLNIRLTENVGLVLNHQGELNIKNFEGLVEREDGMFVSTNYNTAEKICHLNISSDISKLSIEVI